MSFDQFVTFLRGLVPVRLTHLSLDTSDFLLHTCGDSSHKEASHVDAI